MNSIICKPTKTEMNEKLQNLEKWEAFAINLRGINEEDIDNIKEDSHDHTGDLKQLLFEKWLDTHPNPSWGLVIMALKRAGEHELAEELSDSLSHEVQIQEDTVKKLSELHKTFSRLSFECEKALIDLVESGELKLNHLLLRTKKEKAYNFEELSNVKNTICFIDIISAHYHFLNCHLLMVLVEHFLNPSQLLDKLQTHIQNVKNFKDNAKIRYLQKTLTPFTTKSPQEVPVTVRVQNAWEHNEIWLVEVLIQTMFHLEHKDILKLFRVIPGSITIVLLIPHHISLSLIEQSKHKIEFMRLTGIIGLQIGDTYILQDKEIDGYTFEQGLIDSTDAGNYEAVKFLLQCVDVNTQTKPEKKSIHKVKEMADELCKDENENTTFQHDAGTTALMIACCHGDTCILELLIEYNANPNLKTNTGWTGLMYATLLGNTKMTNALLKHKADVNTQKFSNGATALIHACISGNVQIVRALIKKSANVNTRMNNGATPLFIASQNGHLPIVEHLLREKADPNTPKDNGTTPLYVASENGHLPVVERLLQEKVDPNSPKDNGTTPLLIASHNGHLPIVERLLQEKADPNTPMDNGTTPLYVASENGHLPIVKRLLQEKVDPNTSVNNGATPLFIASQNGHLPIVEWLLQEKAEPNIPMTNGARPLHIASQNGHLPVVERLLQEKVDIEVKFKDGQTPLFMASRKGYSDVVQVLLDHGADPTACTNKGDTPLMIATRNGHKDVIQILRLVHQIGY